MLGVFEAYLLFVLVTYLLSQWLTQRIRRQKRVAQERDRYVLPL